jgi:hypothetical protein
MVQHALGKPTALQSPDDAALASGPVPDFGQPAVLLHTQLHLDLVSCFARFRLLDLVAPVQLIRAARAPLALAGPIGAPPTLPAFEPELSSLGMRHTEYLTFCYVTF